MTSIISNRDARNDFYLRASYVVTLTWIALLLVFYLKFRPADSWSTWTLRPCPTEDSINCYWLADTQGNGTGRSFINFDGHTYYRDR